MALAKKRIEKFQKKRKASTISNKDVQALIVQYLKKASVQLSKFDSSRYRAIQKDLGKTGSLVLLAQSNN